MKQSENNIIETSFQSKKGEKIFYRNWKAQTNPKAMFIIVHGLNSHSGYYENFAKELNQNNYAVFAMDLLGRGNSQGERYYIPDFNIIIEDIDKMVNLAKAEYLNLPLFLLGHSAGGVFANVYALHQQHKLKGLISESFAFQLPAPEFVLFFIKMLAYIIPHKKLIRLKNEDFSRDMAIVEKMDNDILLTDEKQATKTMQQLLYAGKVFKKEMKKINLPLLIIHGTSDKATHYEGSRYLYKNVSSEDKELKLYEGHYHDLLNDSGNEIVTKDIIEWLDNRI